MQVRCAMRWILCAGIVLAMTLFWPASASAAPSEAAAPCGSGTDLEPRPVAEANWTQAIGEHGQPERMIEYKLDSCDLPTSGGVFTGQIYGLSLPPAADRVQLIVKSAHSATLIVRIKEGDLHAGEYAGLAMVRDAN